MKAILFDFMGVLLFEKENSTPDPVVDEIDQTIGMVTDDPVFKAETMCRYGLNEAEFNEILVKIADKYERFQPLWELLPDLRNSYKLAIINNGTALTLDALYQKHPVNEQFDLFVSSAREGIGKPDPEIFLLTARRLGVKPEECLFMDDTKTNTESAEKVGMKTIWWQDRWSGYRQFLELLGKDG